ncbi:hypothetical protein [Candidatus Uabimicrobium amorphum]|uniref:Uncharacterized protein n=1 Tax=Uabimicrobium amorphum TaxID=2596890 RepID=A0A5S9IML8_UABAM|nr:hypothetical protein [Candidatus Uabimicrobium amorphum]BBM84321.1 hypothetical protein UABAM_02678 [Candidatus Uabimicrobium amorphum]
MKKLILTYMFFIACIAQQTSGLEDAKKRFFAATDLNKCLEDGIHIASSEESKILVDALTCDNMIAREAAAILFMLAYRKNERTPAYVSNFKLENLKNGTLYEALFVNLQSENRKMNKFAAKLSIYGLKDEMVAFLNHKLSSTPEDQMTAASFLAFVDKSRCELKEILTSGLDHKSDFTRMQAVVGIGMLKCEKQQQLAKLIAMFPAESSVMKLQIIRSCERSEEGLLATTLLLDALTTELINSTNKDDQSLSYRIINLFHLRNAKGSEVEEKALLCIDSKDKYVYDKAVDVLSNLEITNHEKVQNKMIEVLLDGNRMQQTHEGASRVLKNMAVHLSNATMEKLEQLVAKGSVSNSMIKKIKKKRKKAQKTNDK